MCLIKWVDEVGVAYYLVVEQFIQESKLNGTQMDGLMDGWMDGEMDGWQALTDWFFQARPLVGQQKNLPVQLTIEPVHHTNVRYENKIWKPSMKSKGLMTNLICQSFMAAWNTIHLKAVCGFYFCD